MHTSQNTTLTPPSKIKRRYDLRPSSPDPIQGTFLYRKPLRAVLPNYINLTSLCPPIQDQGQMGSCTANAMAGLLSFRELQDFRAKTRMQPEEFAGSGLQWASRLFIYYNERLIEGTTDQDAGASISDSVRSVVEYGFCNETMWPYDPKYLLQGPYKPEYFQALRHRCSQYRALSLYDLHACLADSNPVLIGIQVYQSFEDATDGNIPMPDVNNEQLLGGHAVLIVGYYDEGQYFIVRNSWGENWGMQGYFRLPYAYVSDSNLASDFWTVIK